VRAGPERVAYTANISKVRSTQRKGDIATSRAIATFTAMGFDVSIPLTESAAYDLIADDGHQLARVQCKFASDPRRQVDLRRIHSNSSGYVVKRTSGVIRLALCAGRERLGIPDQRVPRGAPICNASGRRQAWSGGRVRFIAAALKAAGPCRRARGFESLPLRYHPGLRTWATRALSGGVRRHFLAHVDQQTVKTAENRRPPKGGPWVRIPPPPLQTASVLIAAERGAAKAD
jgi:hypothetical protein